MILSFYIPAILCLWAETSFCQSIVSATFSFMSGNFNQTSISAVYPSNYGNDSPRNTPGGRANHDNLVFYNGLLYTFHGSPNNGTNDVWTYNISSKLWSWVAGNSLSEKPSFGTLRVPLVTNTPGCRSKFGGDFHYARKEYILFSGFIIGIAPCDIWSFSVVSNLWTWIHGASFGCGSVVYNTLGVSTPSTTPGARVSHSSIVYPPSGELLIFGGSSIRPDVWSFNFTSMRWTWISGSSIANSEPSVTEQGIWSSANYPGRCVGFQLVFDPRTEIIFRYGGWNQSMQFDGLWGFRRPAVEWAWLRGSSNGMSIPKHGTLGVTSPNNYPGGRADYSITYHEHLGLVMIFGGLGYDATGTSGSLSDLWTMNTQTYEWTWIGGSTIRNQRPDISSIPAIPGCQKNGAMAIDQESGDLLMFGGLGRTLLSPQPDFVDHLWRVVISENSIVSEFEVPSFSATYKESHTLSNYTSPSAVSRDKTLYVGLFTGISTVVIFASAGTLVALTLLSFAVYFRCKQRKAVRTKTVQNSATISSVFTYTDSSSSMSTLTISGQTTYSASEIGIYIPGGLQVDFASSLRTESEIARGGGGVIWLATAFNPVLKTHGALVIVKIPISMQMSERDLALFQQEIALLNAFKNDPHIVKLLGYTDNPYSIVMKYYPLGSLASWIKARKRTPRQSHSFMTDISKGLSTLHNNGIAHCDLKPDNILVQDGSKLSAVITDFGIARIVSDKLLSVPAFQVVQINGASIAYASPETFADFRGKANVVRSSQVVITRDIYALGIIICAILKGESPWQ